MARTVSDAVAVFQVVAGEDLSDTITTRSRGHRVQDYNSSLRSDALKGARIGVLHQAYDRATTDTEVVRVFMSALDDMRKQGAIIIDPVAVPDLDAKLRTSGGCNEFRHDINEWLARQGDKAPVHSLADIIASRRYHPSIQRNLESAQADSLPNSQRPGCAARDQFRAWLRTSVTSLMDSLKLDAMVYPTWSNPPRLIGDLNTPHGDNSQLFSPSTGFPAITVPMGYTRGGKLPAGLQIFGRAWSEPTLIGLAYSYEQATKHRKPPTFASH
jgi:Asp-tRNA(Asn)/Glu-tRNA(Gln) amidotransferase A subunit family amidase